MYICFRKQFPALPTMTPVIPAWQLQQQQNSADKSSPEADNVECRTELKPDSLVPENSENQPSTNASPPETSEPAQHCHVTNGVIDGLGNSDNGEIVEVKIIIISIVRFLLRLLQGNWPSVSVVGRVLFRISYWGV